MSRIRVAALALCKAVPGKPSLAFGIGKPVRFPIYYFRQVYVGAIGVIYQWRLKSEYLRVGYY